MKRGRGINGRDDRSSGIEIRMAEASLSQNPFFKGKKKFPFGRVYDDFSRLLFLHAHREASALSNEIPEESEQFRFLRAACYANIKGSVGLILAKASAMRISIPLDLSSRPFIPPSRFMRSRRAATLLAPSLVFTPRRFA